MKKNDPRIRVIAILIIIDLLYIGKWAIAFLSLVAKYCNDKISIPVPTKHWLDLHRDNPIWGITMFVIAVICFCLVVYIFKKDKEEKEVYKKYPQNK